MAAMPSLSRLKVIASISVCSAPLRGVWRAVGCEKLLHGEYAQKARRPSARTSNVPLLLPATAEGGRFEGVTLKAHIAADLSRIAINGGAGYRPALPAAIV